MKHVKIAKNKCSRQFNQQLNFTVLSDVVKLFDQKRKERDEPNRSKLLEYLMICWIYGYDDNCKECPFYEEPEKEE